MHTSALRQLYGWRLGVICLASSYAVFAQGTVAPGSQKDFLANNTVLIIRHAEKPASGAELTPAGEARAQAYAHYFEPFQEDNLHVTVDALYAGADSESSYRPRLTLEPLSRATGIKVNASVSTKEPIRLVSLLRSEPHGRHPLIAWRHGQIPALLDAFHVPASLLPSGKWPDDTYDWVIVLHFDDSGRLQREELVKEHLRVALGEE